MLIQRSQVSAFFSNVQIRRATITNALSLYRTEINYPRFQKSENLRDVAASSSPSPPAFRSGQERGTGGIDGVEAKKRLAVFVSGGGSNFRAIYDSIQNGSCNGEIVVVVTNAPTCKAAEFALSRDIPVLAYPPPSSKTSTAAALSEVVRPVEEASLTHELLNNFSVDFVILAGYMKLVPCSLVQAYHRAMLNIHPGLLPSFGGQGFYGIRVHRAVIASGARFSGPTVHFVDEEYDRGPILAQAIVPVSPTDTPEMLAARVLREEHKLYPLCVAALCNGHITWRDDGIPILWNAS